ncbi:MAG TPA: sugar ABC transporter ATP-binding protein [Bryobacteraceae bacterium]|nr:sugar ABC transporter ATP-binding protein [Bryobacteraceae bacterium]
MSALLRLEGISKAFGGVPALEEVGLEVAAGEVHALVGENGAGKSTLMNIAAGVLRADCGTMFWDGQPVQLHSPRAAQDLGITFVHQELALVPQLSAGENIFLGRHPARYRWVGWREIHARAAELLRELGHEIDPRRCVGELSIGEQQLVEIARALASNARLIIMDEPTAPLSGHETSRLLQVVGRLRARGVSVIYITHRLKEVYQGPDRVTVLRDGRHVATAPVQEMPQEVLVRHMVGRAVEEQFPERESEPQPMEALRAEGFTAAGSFENVSFRVNRGEVVGLAGLVGAGRTELLESLFGARPHDAGSVFVAGQAVRIRSPRDAVRHGMALVPDDRKGKSLILGASVRWNMVLACQRRLVIDEARETAMATRMTGELRIRSAGVEQSVGELSGGNQQKVVLARWLLADAGIFLLDEPTRGVDVGAKAEIYDIISRLAGRGAAVLLVSSELDEVLHLSDRIVVMHRGRITGELRRAEANEERVMHLATGGNAAWARS